MNLTTTTTVVEKETRQTVVEPYPELNPIPTSEPDHNFYDLDRVDPERHYEPEPNLNLEFDVDFIDSEHERLRKVIDLDTNYKS